MYDLISAEVAKADSLDEVQDLLVKLFSGLKEGGAVQRVGIVIGILVADGPDYVEQNLRRMDTFTSYIRERHTFPVFSLTDIFSGDLRDLLIANQVQDEQIVTFWEQVLASGFVTDLFLTPHWDRSFIAQETLEQAEKLKVKVHYWDIFDLYPAYRR